MLLGSPCLLKEYPAGYVCVCNETYCDTYEDIVPPAKGSYILTTSSQAGLRFHTQKGNLNKSGTTNILVKDFGTNTTNSIDAIDVQIKIYPKRKLQTMVGFGGAYTGSVAYVLSQTPYALRSNFYK